VEDIRDMAVVIAALCIIQDLNAAGQNLQHIRSEVIIQCQAKLFHQVQYLDRGKEGRREKEK
jgi:hypothetical protein